MNSVFDIAQSSIKIGGFVLNEKLRELTSILIVGQINVDEYEELTKLAQEYADPENEPTEINILGALKTLNTQIVKLEKRLSVLENSHVEDTEEEYPAWERWNGLPNSGYQFGAKVTHLGIKYISNYTGLNVWEPGIQGTETLWTVVG